MHDLAQDLHEVHARVGLHGPQLLLVDGAACQRLYALRVQRAYDNSQVNFCCCWKCLRKIVKESWSIDLMVEKFY